MRAPTRCSLRALLRRKIRATDEPDSAYCSGAVFSASCGSKSGFKFDFTSERGPASVV